MDSNDISTLERIEAYALGALNASNCMAFGTIVDNIRMLIDKLKKPKINPHHHSPLDVLDSDIGDTFAVNDIDIFLPARSVNCLRAENINTLDDLVNKKEQELRIIPNFGPKSLNEVKEFLAAFGLSLKL